ncbi:hypothetical protein GmRootV116_19670 [Variovorax sp. V116]
MEQVTLMLLLPLRLVADESTVPKSIFEPAPATTEQALATVIRTWNVAVAGLVAAKTALVVTARVAATMRESFFMVNADWLKKEL